MLDSDNERPVSEIMSRYVLTIDQSSTVQEAVYEMNVLNVGSILIVGPHKQLLGIFSERDLLVRVVGKDKDPKKTIISDVMTRNIKTVNMHDSINKVFASLFMSNFRHFPVVDNSGNLAGIVSVKDFKNKT
ncbi:MAG: CBS domain-containing protein [Candidatus Omnitrophica bacterium]|nr:CBS domain-containing protein [Candidatus Omnitrophota bacterium]